MTQSSILVVGATGTVGSRVVRQLADAGVRPRVLVRSPEKAEALAAFATPVVADLLAPESLEPAFRGAERVFILAPPTPDLETLERNAIDAAAAAGARRIVFLSNYGAKAGDEEDWHFDVHGRHEQLIAKREVDWTVLRPTRFMNYAPFVWPSVLNQGLLLEGGGAGAMTFIDPDDIAAIGVKALTEDGHEGQIYELTSQETYTAATLASLLSKMLARPLRIFQGDVDALREALAASGAPGEYAPIMARYFGKVAAGFFRPTDTVAKVLGRAPRAYADWLADNMPAAVSRAAAQ
jgi:uncharacterized protein YbjT (DUF2867 family)